MDKILSIFDFGKKRTFLEAVIFFIVYFILTRTLFSILSYIFTDQIDKVIFPLTIGIVVFPFDLGVILVILVMLLLTLLVLYQKGLLKSPKYLLVFPLVFVISFFYYNIGGLTIITFITTRNGTK